MIILILLMFLYYIPAFAILALIGSYVFSPTFRGYIKPFLKKPFTRKQLLKATVLAIVPIANAWIFYSAVSEYLTHEDWLDKPFE